MTHTQTQGADGAGTKTAGQIPSKEPIAILYENWRGETGVRHIIVGGEGTDSSALWFGLNQWHRVPQHLISAWDVEKGAYRDFALSGIKAWGQAAVDAALADGAGTKTAGHTTQKKGFKPGDLVRRTYAEWVGGLFPAFGETAYVQRVSDKHVYFTPDQAGIHEDLFTLVSPAPATPPGVPDSLRALSEDYARKLDARRAATSAYNAAYDAILKTGRSPKFDELLAERSVSSRAETELTDATIVLLDACRYFAAQPAGQAGDAGASIGGKGIPARMDAIASGQAGDAGAKAMRAAAAEVARNSAAVCGEGELYVAHKIADEIEALQIPAPNSTRTGAEETESLRAIADRLVTDACELPDRTSPEDQPEVLLVTGDELHSFLTQAMQDALAARPEAPSDAGWRDISTAPKDGTEIWAWLHDSGVRKVRWWTAEEICEEEDRGTPDDYLAGFYEVADRTEWWNFRWWVPAECLPTPPSDPAPSGQAEG